MSPTFKYDLATGKLFRHAAEAKHRYDNVKSCNVRRTRQTYSAFYKLLLALQASLHSRIQGILTYILSCGQENVEKEVGGAGGDGNNMQEADHKPLQIRCANCSGDNNCVWAFAVRVHVAQPVL